MTEAGGQSPSGAVEDGGGSPQPVVQHVGGGRETIPWGMMLRVVAVVAGSAAWVQLVGSLDMWTRFDRLGIAPTSTVALVPRDLLFAAGVRTLTAPIALGIVAFGALVLWPAGQRQRRGTGPLPPVAGQRENPRGQQPPGLKTILALLAIITSLFILWRPVEWDWTIVLLATTVLAVLLIYTVVVCTDSFAHVAVALFVGTALFGGVIGLARQYGEPAKLDIAVALRNDGSAIGGFYLGRGSESMYLLTTAQPGGKNNNVVTAGQSAPEESLALAAQPCTTRAITRKEHCYIQEVVGLRSDDIVKFTIGPRGVEVNPQGYAAARVLAQVALLRADEEVITPETTTTVDAGG